jgi:hypothetical protein
MPDYPKGDWMSPWQADEKIEARAQQDWEQNTGGPAVTLAEARERVKAWARRDGWAEKAVAVIGITRATQVYFDAYAALQERASEKKTPAQLDAEIADALAKRSRR